MDFFSPKNFKKGQYYFGKYNTTDLLILIPSVIVGSIICLMSILSIILLKTLIVPIIGIVVGGLIVLIAFVLTLPFGVYHNILGFLINIICFEMKQKKYEWPGYDYNNYDDSLDK